MRRREFNTLASTAGDLAIFRAPAVIGTAWHDLWAALLLLPNGPPWSKNKTLVRTSHFVMSAPREPRKAFRLSRRPSLFRRRQRRRQIIGRDGNEGWLWECWPLLVLAAIWKFGVPWIELTLNTVSTDDAYVNGHVTFVAARVSGQVARVLVDDNNRVRKGEVLVQLDREPYEVVVAEKRAAVETAKADLLAAAAAVRGLEAQARGQYWQLQNAMEDVDNRVALLHARVAALDKSNAKFKLAQLDFARAEQLLPSQTISQQEYDRRQAVLSESQAEVTQAMADVDQIRVSLGLPKKPDSGELGEVPPDLDQTFSSVRDVQAALIRTAAQLGVGHSYEQLPKQMLQQFESLNRGDVDRTLAELTANAPAVKQAQAKLDVANRDLDQAELNLRYCDIVAEIDGV